MSSLTHITFQNLEELPNCHDPYSAEEWSKFGLYVSYQALLKIRESRLEIKKFHKSLKADNSPVTNFEREIEEFILEALNKYYSNAGFIGEELGEINADSEIIILVDPIDGTWSFLSGFDSYCFTFSVLVNKRPVFSAISVPANGEMAFRINNERSQIFQIPILSDPIQCYDLPVTENNTQKNILINFHPSKHGLGFLKDLYKEWEEGNVSLVKSVSGSPSLQLLEVAKGYSIYINSWSQGKTKPFDLISAAHILEGAGGLILNMEGKSVDLWNHSGLFIAGKKANHLNQIIQAIKLA